jgi:hypothetical protein
VSGLTKLQGYHAGYRAGLKKARQQLTNSQKQRVVQEWLLEKRSEILQRKAELDRQIEVLSAEENLRSRGFVFPAGFSRQNAEHMDR